MFTRWVELDTHQSHASCDVNPQSLPSLLSPLSSSRFPLLSPLSLLLSSSFLSLIPSPFPSQMHRHSLLTVLMNVLLTSSLGRGLPTGKESTLQMRMRRMICLLDTLHRVDCARGVAWEIPLMVMKSFLHTRSTDSSSWCLVNDIVRSVTLSTTLCVTSVTLSSELSCL